MLSLGGRHFLERRNEMADDFETVDNVENIAICVQIFYSCDFFERNNKILKRSIIEYIYICINTNKIWWKKKSI